MTHRNPKTPISRSAQVVNLQSKDLTSSHNRAPLLQTLPSHFDPLMLRMLHPESETIARLVWEQSSPLTHVKAQNLCYSGVTRLHTAAAAPGDLVQRICDVVDAEPLWQEHIGRRRAHSASKETCGHI